MLLQECDELSWVFCLTFTSSIIYVVYGADREETVHAYGKIVFLSPPPAKLPARDPKIWQHIILCSLCLKLLFYCFKSLSIQTFPHIRFVDDVILRSFCSVNGAIEKLHFSSHFYISETQP